MAAPTIQSLITSFNASPLSMINSLLVSFGAVVKNDIKITFSADSGTAGSSPITSALTIPAGTFGSDFTLSNAGSAIKDALGELEGGSLAGLLGPANTARIEDLLDDAGLDALIPRVGELLDLAADLRDVVTSGGELSITVSGGPVALSALVSGDGKTLVDWATDKPLLSEPFFADFDFAAMSVDSSLGFMAFG